MSLYFTPQPPRRRMVLMLLFSMAIHGGAIGVMALVRRAPAMPDSPIEGAETGIELIDDASEPELNAESFSDPTPEFESQITNNFADEMLGPTPAPAPAVIRASIKSPKPVPVLRVGSTARHPGNRPAVASIGAPGAWSTPKPSYPYQARRMRVQGSGAVRVTTDASGRVVRAEMAPGIDPWLDLATMSYARVAWMGPPNATKTIPITFALE